MFPVQFRPDRHKIVDVPFATFIRRHLNDDDLFVYFHLEAENYIVAYWVNKTRQIMMELAILGKSPVADRGIVESLELMREGGPRNEENKAKNMEFLKGAESMYDRQEEEEGMEIQDAWDALSRVGKKKRQIVVPQ